MDAVGMEILTVLQSLVQFLIILLGPPFVGSLDAASGRGVVSRRGQSDHCAVREVEGTLYQPLAEGTAADDHPAVVVLHCSGENLAGRSGTLVDKDDEFALGIGACIGTLPFLAVGMKTLRIDDELVFLQKLVNHVDGRVQIASRIAPQVEDQRLHPLAAQLFQGALEFLGGLLGKTV